MDAVDEQSMNEISGASSPTGTIGHGHYLQVMRRCDQITARLDQLVAMFSAGDAHRLRHESQISELLTGMQEADQQCRDRARGHDHLQSRLAQVDRRLYAMQQEILSRTTTIASPPPAATPEADTDISDSEGSSGSLRSRSSPNDDSLSPVPSRSFRRSQELDANANPFEMPLPVNAEAFEMPSPANADPFETPMPQMPPIDKRVEQRPAQFERSRGGCSMSARPIVRQYDRQSRGRGQMVPMRSQRQPFGRRRGPPPPGLTQHGPTLTADRAYSESAVKHVSVICKELSISKSQHEFRRRPLPGQPRLSTFCSQKRPGRQPTTF